MLENNLYSIETNENNVSKSETQTFSGNRRRSDAFTSLSFIDTSDGSKNIDHNDECAYISEREDKHESLILSTLQVVRQKDFSNEVRCMRDIDIFVKDPRIILDSNEFDLGSIIVEMLSFLGFNTDGIDEATKVIYAENSAKLLAKSVQGIYLLENGQYNYDHSWICTFCCLPNLEQRRVCITRLLKGSHLGITSQNIRFIILVLSPVNEKMTKSAEEASLAFATLFSSLTFRLALLSANTATQFTELIARRAQTLCSIKKESLSYTTPNEKCAEKYRFGVGRGLIENVTRRSKYYISDFVDGFIGHKTLRKTSAATFSLYFACILPCIAFGVLDDKNTGGKIDTRRALIGQTIGGLVFAFLSGQPLVIIMTTAPLCLYTKVVFDISNDMKVDFYDMFACVGLWNSLFVMIYALFDTSYVMKWCTRSTEEIFALFIFFAFSVDAIKDCVRNFNEYYCISNSETQYCAQQNSVLFLLLMLATVLLAVLLYNFNKTPYLNGNTREIFSDYALPIAVIAFSFVGTFLFRDIQGDKFKFSESFEFSYPSFKTLRIEAIFVGMGLGFVLSLLFFMDQNISAAMVNNPHNNLKKGSAYHLDLLIVGILNAFLSIFGMPWMHGILPHSPLHARSLADVEQHVDNGHVRQVVIRVRETRITGIFTHILIGLSLLLIPHPLDYIPVAVLNGLFLYCAIASLRGNTFFERILLFVTEQSAYPPNHYIKRAPQRNIHIFTICQLIQLVILCFFGFSPWAYVQMAFPLIIAILIPIRKEFSLYLFLRYVMDLFSMSHKKSITAMLTELLLIIHTSIIIFYCNINMLSILEKNYC